MRTLGQRHFAAWTFRARTLHGPVADTGDGGHPSAYRHATRTRPVNRVLHSWNDDRQQQEKVEKQRQEEQQRAKVLAQHNAALVAIALLMAEEEGWY